MTQEEILEGKKLVLEFMGVEPKKFGDRWSWSHSPFFYVDYPEKEKVLQAMAEYTPYNTSWDWLMPFIYKCLTICHEKMLNEWENGFCDAFLSGEISTLYKEGLEFIKWYNQNK